MGELARKPGAPQMPETPLELITPRPGEALSDFEIYGWPIAGGFVGASASMMMSAVRKRPIWSGLPRHIISAAAFTFVGMFVRDVKNASSAEADAVIRHYISLHPEDFPPFERKRWSEVYMPFQPTR